MRQIEAISMAHKYAFLVQQIITELFCIYVQIVVNEVCGSISISILVQIFMSIKPFVDFRFVFINYISASCIELIDMLKSNCKNPFIKYSSTYGR